MPNHSSQYDPRRDDDRARRSQDGDARAWDREPGEDRGDSGAWERDRDRDEDRGASGRGYPMDPRGGRGEPSSGYGQRSGGYPQGAGQTTGGWYGGGGGYGGNQSGYSGGGYGGYGGGQSGYGGFSGEMRDERGRDSREDWYTRGGVAGGQRSADRDRDPRLAVMGTVGLAGRGFAPSGELGRQVSHRGRGPQGYTRSDQRIAEDINDRLTDDDVVDATDIEVKVQGAEVTLTGKVPERQMKYRAEEIAEQVSGVRDVDNQIRVARGDRDRGHDGGKGSGGAKKSGASA